jgi:hypothetical protein
MKIVGDHLTGVAANRADVMECDLFGRSAFNRYYYGAYLIAREMLMQLDPAWARTAHSDIPDLLEGAVINKIRKEAKNQEQAGLLSKTASSSLRNSAATAVTQLSQLLRSAYGVRIVADYDPGSQISRNGKILILVDHSTDEAKRWQGRATQATGTILNIWRRLGIP